MLLGKRLEVFDGCCLSAPKNMSRVYFLLGVHGSNEHGATSTLAPPSHERRAQQNCKRKVKKHRWQHSVHGPCDQTPTEHAFAGHGRLAQTPHGCKVNAN
eukprot:1568415-Alexandrium_andersonii.AAC.1